MFFLADFLSLGSVVMFLLADSLPFPFDGVSSRLPLSSDIIPLIPFSFF